MQLSDHDLKQLDEQRVRSLQAKDLRSLSLKLLADLKEARDREGKQETQTKDPPPDEEDTKGVERKEREPSEKPRGKPGKPKGTPGHGRSLERGVTAERTHRPESCAVCGKPLPPEAPQPAHNGH